MLSLRSFRVLLLLAMLVPFAVPQEANAILMRCRSDPVVMLSNGSILDISVYIDTLPMNVQEVHYVLHGPSDLSLVLAIPTPTWISSYETFQYIADQPAGHFYTETFVKTKKDPVDVTAELILVSVNGLTLGVSHADGISGQTVANSFSY